MAESSRVAGECCRLRRRGLRRRRPRGHSRGVRGSHPPGRRDELRRLRPLGPRLLLSYMYDGQWLRNRNEASTTTDGYPVDVVATLPAGWSGAFALYL